MPIIAIYEVETVVDDNFGDVGQLQQATGVVPDDTIEIDFYIGSRFNGKFDIPRQGFWRYEVDKPAGATIIGVKFEGEAVVLGTLGPIDMYGGFLKQQDTANAWEDSDGCFEWQPSDFNIPLVDFNSPFGVIHDEDVFWGGSVGFPEQALQVVSGDQKWQIGEGTFTGNSAADVTGLIAQLQGYLDDSGNETTRGSTKADSIPVMFTVLRDFVGLRDQSQALYSVGSPDVSRRPKLFVEYTTTVPPVVTITSPATDPHNMTNLDTVTLIATSIDDLDGDISSGIEWSSDIDGPLGTGASLADVSLSGGPVISPQTHIIEAKSTDSDGNVGIDTITIIVTIQVEPNVFGAGTITRPVEAATLTRPVETANLSRPSNATATRPAVEATLTRPVESTTLTRPAESASVQRPPESTDLKPD